MDPDVLNLQLVLDPIFRTDQGLTHIVLEMGGFATVSQDSLEPDAHWRPRLGKEPEEKTPNIIALQQPQGPTRRPSDTAAIVSARPSAATKLTSRTKHVSCQASGSCQQNINTLSVLQRVNETIYVFGSLSSLNKFSLSFAVSS